jgi:alpha-galactosidase
MIARRNLSDYNTEKSQEKGTLLMRTKKLLGVAVLWLMFASLSFAAVAPTEEEMGESRRWAETKFSASGASKAMGQFFSFTYDGKSSANLLKIWKCKTEEKKLDERRTESTLTYADPKTGLEIRCVAVAYSDFPVVEWTVYAKNTGDKDTPILENLQGLDTRFVRTEKAEFVLHGIKGDLCTADSFEPYQLPLGPNAAVKRSPPGNSGKSCDGAEGWPYYNLQTPDGGVIIAVGWPGQWESSFTRDAKNGLRITAGQQLTHLSLKPGEEIRTPLVAILFWKGADVERSQNLWRRWYLQYVLPHFDGKPHAPIAQIQTGASDGEITRVEQFLKAGIKPDVCWHDAGWYPLENGPYKGAGFWLNTGTWEPDPKRYPKGFRPFSDWVRAKNMKFLLWFEPERVGDPNSYLGKNHPDWLLPETDSTVGKILDEGNPQAWKWLVEHIDGMIKKEGLDWYREDMNGCGPLPAWRKNDAENRQGITENFYVQGHLKFWDELKRRNPSLHIDSCASGGRRNDLETMRRAVPLLRSDFQFPDSKGVVEGNQGHTYGLSMWLPFQGTGVYFYDTYSVRSFYLPSFGMGGLTPENTEAQKQAYRECGEIAPLMLYGDYYPLTPYNLQLDRWIGWQFNDAEKGEGVVQAFCRAECKEKSIRLKLHSLEPDAVYTLKNFDEANATEATGKELMDAGLAIEVKEQPGAVIVRYQKK